MNQITTERRSRDLQTMEQVLFDEGGESEIASLRRIAEWAEQKEGAIWEINDTPSFFIRPPKSIRLPQVLSIQTRHSKTLRRSLRFYFFFVYRDIDSGEAICEEFRNRLHQEFGWKWKSNNEPSQPLADIADLERCERFLEIFNDFYDEIVNQKSNRKIFPSHGTTVSRQSVALADGSGAGKSFSHRMSVSKYIELDNAVTQLEQEGYFDPQNVKDERKKTMREIAQRQGQQEFRNALLTAYDRRCAVTSCDAPATLEAAHIIPYMGPDTHHITNGILLRSDIHTLFDRGLIRIDPQSLTIAIDDELLGTYYEKFNGRKINLPNRLDAHPSQIALESKWLEKRH